MKNFLILVSLVAATQAFGKWDEGLKVRFGIGLGVGRDFFIDMPQTLNAAKNARWVESPRPAGQPMSSLVLYNPSRDDVVIGVFFDQAGDVAGLQIALPQDTIQNFPYNWTVQGYREWTAPANSYGVNRTYWTTAMYFVSEETLAKSPEERAATRKGRVLQEDHVYVTGYYGELMAISTEASQVADTENTLFTRQACITFMGRHYHYNMTTETECTADQIYPWFTLVDEAEDANQLLAIGLQAFGTLDPEYLVRDYFERPSESFSKTVIVNAPQCLYDGVAEYGGLTMHVYFVNSPLLINCFFT